MENIKKIILEAVPEALIDEKQKLTATVAPQQLHGLAKKLKEEGFDLLVILSGIDLGEKLGVVYLLSSSKNLKREVVLKTATEDRNNPLLYSVSDLWETANMNEREVFAMFGIRFINHPDMRRLFLNQDWNGFPFRKDYNTHPALNALSLESKDIVDESKRIIETAQGVKEEKYEIFSKDDYVINIGPQHPATHGVLHFRIALDGETVDKVDVHCGYIHRGIEKLSENLTYPQILHFTDRLDYLSAHINRHGLCMCIEKAAEIEVPERAVYIRTMMDELTRIASHLLSWACMAMDMGALTAFIYGMRDREKIMDIFEGTCGGRLITNYNVIGGVMDDLAPDFQKQVTEFIPYMRKMLKEYDMVFTGNVIARQRMEGVGILPLEAAISYGVTGPVGRGSGFACDLRKHAPYAAYDKVEFKEIIRTECDSRARYLNRLDEISESLNILEQLVDIIPSGSFYTKPKPIIKLPEGEYFQRIEACRGEFGIFIESRGDKTPYRIKFRSPSLALVSIMPLITEGGKIADFIAIGGSMDYVIPDIDR